MRVYQHIKAPNDSNGNPRRLYIVYEVSLTEPQGADVVAVFEEAYMGIPAALKSMASLYPVSVAVSEYNGFIKLGKSKGVYF